MHVGRMVSAKHVHPKVLKKQKAKFYIIYLQFILYNHFWVRMTCYKFPGKCLVVVKWYFLEGYLKGWVVDLYRYLALYQVPSGQPRFSVPRKDLATVLSQSPLRRLGAPARSAGNRITDHCVRRRGSPGRKTKAQTRQLQHHLLLYVLTRVGITGYR